jgi:hypothetical protein
MPVRDAEMIDSTPNRLNRSITLLLMLPILLWLTVQPLLASPVETTSGQHLPSEYGQVIYRTDTNAPARIYIIANSHRSAATGANGSETLQAQIETFRIGEWLIHQEHVGLLFPEGFFGHQEKAFSAAETPHPFDKRALQQRLADTSVFTNAELLLHEQHGITLHQVEDRSIYLKTREQILSGRNESSLLSPSTTHELEYLQRLRTSTILQNSIQALLESHRDQALPPSQSAILTIGLSHLDHVITYLETGMVQSPASLISKETYPPGQAKLDLLEAPIDITVIVPRSLLEKPLLVMADHL